MCVWVFIHIKQNCVVRGGPCITFCVRVIIIFIGPVCLLIVFRWSATQDELLCLAGWAVWLWFPLCPGPLANLITNEMKQEFYFFLDTVTPWLCFIVALFLENKMEILSNSDRYFVYWKREWQIPGKKATSTPSSGRIFYGSVDICSPACKTFAGCVINCSRSILLVLHIYFKVDISRQKTNNP